MSDLGNEPGAAVRLRLAEEGNVWLCTVRPDGSAHVTPVWFVYQSSRWWIGSDLSSVKVRNIRQEPRVSLALEDGRFPVVAEGDALLLGEAFPHEIVTAFEQKYAWDVSASTRPGSKRVLLEVRVRRWLLAGTAQ
ncbi:pyridoxamine 5'-phosphate oxidase family protein [Streptomyces sparsogenes]|uniref:Pyridoxamine 5'-phosphate oxidase-related FMN-binding protein n=1 Tax=Streptomyces sparsogenes DSM 40356 TaxID=1331668 RepID=A0A1R1SBB1_9ACTN|nr:pyridoxamine 5'-phosphate oxidase family protein [Streptomyces sparsogenes]OMI35606.1 pyridoxamine 5'-phosphate oxidase-related FMN- binding protein [Streptomyces sparsogenes DSM 40356]